MQVHFTIKNTTYRADLSQPIDISIPLRDGLGNPNCFYAPPVEFSPVVAGDFIGSTRQGGLLNFMNVKFNPHGNGTHTECVGHIAKEVYTINNALGEFFFLAQLITLYPQQQTNGDRVIVKTQLEDAFPSEAQAVVIRTQPNDDTKSHRQYSGTNPPYLHHEAATYLVECSIKHLLLDLPSVDREEDEGKLLTHKAFWQYPDSPRTDCTITEMIYVPDTIKDGLYLLNIQIPSFELDAAPSKPVLYELKL